ncbi:hypothetical protein ASG40_00600 [Methylobacterium sp. Leaf399]|uniref:class I SAM-dependent methyltransferase n=1 Tax=Methylobacterium sp. Leaf399 TaxID=1736364 RepID=UPI00070152BD|nr:class I SAM-dependent methyltransferase [Methylobacterium sp. Leaf399]KQT19392.1 hypothetical protein ASG40_00600 [Methylobacterium sp. Leaf399]
MHAVKNLIFHGVGLGAMGLAAARHRIGGYRRPTDFASEDLTQAIAHVVEIVQDWNDTLSRLGTHPRSVRGLDVLELGPGATLGTGVLLRGFGASSYLAVDVNELAAQTPSAFYRMIAEAPLPDGCDPAIVRAVAESLAQGQDAGVGYATDPDFDIVRAAAGRTFDVVVSNAAFEHFDDVDAVIADLGPVMRPGAVFIAMVDFQTHSRWVRRVDPNSIYRIGPSLYRAMTFPGQPNRLRPRDYLESLARHGWRDAQVHPVDRAPPDYLAWSRRSLAADYRDDEARMDVLTGIVTARKP